MIPFFPLETVNSKKVYLLFSNSRVYCCCLLLLFAAAATIIAADADVPAFACHVFVRIALNVELDELASSGLDTAAAAEISNQPDRGGGQVCPSEGCKEGVPTKVSFPTVLQVH